MIAVPEWGVIVLALASAACVRSYFGGVARVVARLWVVAFYAFLWLGPDDYNSSHMVVLSRYGLALLFLSDIIPALVAAYQRRYRRTDDSNPG